MFFNNCWGFKCHCHCKQEEYKPTRPCCKCEQEKPSCTIDKYCCKHHSEYEQLEQKKCGCNAQNNFSDNKFGFCEYNNLGYFAEQNGDDGKNNGCKYDKNYNYDNDYADKCYTPNWDNDKYCNCNKDKHNKCDRNYKPVKYICTPCDRD